MANEEINNSVLSEPSEVETPNAAKELSPAEKFAENIQNEPLRDGYEEVVKSLANVFMAFDGQSERWPFFFIEIIQFNRCF
jgi:hypothetical protein